MAYPQTDQNMPQTARSVWYAYSILIHGEAVGSFERFSARSTRTVERVREVLFSRGAEVVELLPGGTDTSIDLSFVELYQSSLLEVVGGEIHTLEDMTFPLDILEQMRIPQSQGGGRRNLVYLDAWASDWGKELDSGGTKVVESMTFQVRTVRGGRGS